VAVAPIRAVERLLLTTFRLRRLFNAVSVVVGLGALLLMVLLFSLSLRMRREEFRTCQRIGARRQVLVAMVLAEVLLLLGFAAAATAALTACSSLLRPLLTERLVSRRQGEGG
jgi:predicted lysophospholipase L1 biosynthesis ABC-type transport system permease subunit